MSKPAGYSGTPLAKKLGFKAGLRVKTKRAPAGYRELVEPIPDGVTLSPRLRGRVDILHLFVRRNSELQRDLPVAQSAIEQNGAIWVSWPKKSSGVASDVTEDRIRSAALPLGLVDIKVCAVDDVWSGLKLVIRRELRQS